MALGDTGKRGKVLQHPSSQSGAPPIETFGPPAALVGDALAVWHELAPHAFVAKTLMRGTEAAFVMGCRWIAKERQLAASGDCAGPDHRGLMQRVATWMKDFGLAPLGKPMPGSVPIEQPASKLDRFMKAR